jgi:hypothetical protein
MIPQRILRTLYVRVFGKGKSPYALPVSPNEYMSFLLGSKSIPQIPPAANSIPCLSCRTIFYPIPFLPPGGGPTSPLTCLSCRRGESHCLICKSFFSPSIKVVESASGWRVMAKVCSAICTRCEVSGGMNRVLVPFKKRKRVRKRAS